MLKKKLLLILFVWQFGYIESVTLQPSFERLGFVATGLSYGHVHGHFNFNSLRHAHQEVVRVVEQQMKTRGTPEERMFIEALRPQLTAAEKTIEDLHLMFFGDQHRQKRQLFIGLAMALGLVSVGTSIYTATEVTKLHQEMTDIRSSVQRNAHLLDAEAHAINRVVDNMKTIGRTCKFVLEKIDLQEKQIVTLTNVLGLTTLISNLNAELLAWGRGLEALQEGRLHPALIDHGKIKKVMTTIQEKARKLGKTPLHEDEKMLFKSPVSHLVMLDGTIAFIVHVPLIEQVPMELFRYHSIPIEMNNFYLEVTTEKTILATDARGQTGMELREENLVKCQTEDWHKGRIFICPSMSVHRNNIRQTCLGALFYEDRDGVVGRCRHVLSENVEEEVQQLGKDEILIFSMKEQTLVQRCANGSSHHSLPKGLSRRMVKPQCEVTTEHFSFRSPQDFDLTESFIQREIETGRFQFLEKNPDKKIQEALREMKKMKEMKKIDLQEIEKWIANEQRNQWNRGVHWTTSAVAAVVGFMAIFLILYLYVQYRRAKK